MMQIQKIQIMIIQFGHYHADPTLEMIALGILMEMTQMWIFNNTTQYYILYLIDVLTLPGV